MDIFGFEFIHTVSTRPEEKFIGSVAIWDTATKALIDALEAKGLDYTINEGDGAFYGPKIDIKLKDAIGRLWQCATIQCDFNLPERFDLSYIGQDGEKHRPVMLHRVILGSVDRFLGVLIEHFAGAFPVWISPVQVKIMNITDESAEYAEKLYRELKQAGIRAEKDLRNEKIGYKIREAQMEKVPHMIVVGNNEMNENKVSVRLRNGETKNNLDFSAYISVLKSLIDSKSLELSITTTSGFSALSSLSQLLKQKMMQRIAAIKAKIPMPTVIIRTLFSMQILYHNKKKRKST